MEFRQLRYFIAVAEEGNLSAAARRLHISQPPITRQVQQLEYELGVVLFTRTSRGVELTAAGKAFLPSAQALLDQTKRSIEQTRAAARGQVGRLSVGYFGSTIYDIVPSALRAFRIAAPEVEIDLVRASKEDQIKWLRDGRLGVGFARYYAAEPDLLAVPVAHERLYVARPADQGSAGKLRLWDLRNKAIVLFPKVGRPSFADEIMTMLAGANAVPRVVDEAEDVVAALALVTIKGGCCIVPASVTRLKWPGLRFAPLADQVAVSPVQCLHRREGVDPVVASFLQHLASHTSTEWMR